MEYLPVKETDIPIVIDLYTRYLNGGAAIGEGIRESWARGAYFGCRAVEDGETAGIFTMREGLEFTYPHPELEEELRRLAVGRHIYTVDALLVLPEYRCEGIAHHMIAHAVGQMRRRSPGVVLSEIWIYPDGRCPGQEPQETIGRVFYKKKVPLFYRNLDRYGLTCPICGTRCVCGAWVELMEVWEAPKLPTEGNQATEAAAF